VDTENSTPWYLRVVPTTALALVVLGALVLLVPGVRDQVRLSVSRQSQGVVELYFPTPVEGTEQACLRHGADVRVGFVLVSHLDHPERMGYRVALDPDARGARTVSHGAGLLTQPGTARTPVTRLAAPRTGGFTVSVSLPSQGEQIHVHCAGASR